jgi:YbbR domain-containing protein
VKSKAHWKYVITENLSYKVVALFIAIILWLTIMGRRDLILTKNIEVEFKTASVYRVVGQTADQIRIRLSGPRNSLKEIMDGTRTKPLTIDISDRGEGIFDIDIPINRIDLPPGVKILSVRPNLVRVEVAK